MSQIGNYSRFCGHLIVQRWETYCQCKIYNFVDILILQMWSFFEIHAREINLLYSVGSFVFFLGKSCFPLNLNNIDKNKKEWLGRVKEQTCFSSLFFFLFLFFSLRFFYFIFILYTFICNLF